MRFEQLNGYKIHSYIHPIRRTITYETNKKKSVDFFKLLVNSLDTYPKSLFNPHDETRAKNVGFVQFHDKLLCEYPIGNILL